MSRAKIVRDSEGLFYGIRFNCPGCSIAHEFTEPHILPISNWRPNGETEESRGVAGKDHWTFNGDFEKPVFGPSVLRRYQIEDEPKYVCHSFVGCNGAQPGQIIFLGDSTHALAGQIVNLPELDDK